MAAPTGHIYEHCGICRCFSFNLFTCAEGIGNPVNGMFGISPPTVAEYLFSANNDLLVPLVAVQGEDDNFGAEPDGNPLYYHVLEYL
jgi:hypothetical protein